MEQNSYIASIIGILFACAALADVVELTNGQKLDGQVVRETTNHVVINMGLGEVKLPRSKVRAVIRSAPADDAMMQAAWREKYFAHEKYVPERLKPLAAEFDSVCGLRRSARASSSAIEQLKRDIQSHRAQENAEKADWFRTHENIRQYPANPEFTSQAEIDTYNGLVSKANALQSSIVLRQQAVETSSRKIDEHHSNMANYIKSLDEFHLKLGKEKAQSTNETVFLTQASRQISSFDGELRRVELQDKGGDGHALLDVTINDKQTGKFILDTGASLVVLSRDFARWLHVETSTNETVRVVLANGQEEVAQPVLLTSVQCGGARSTDVPAVVMEKSPGPGVDGLLGMSFLRNYILRVNAGSREVELIQLLPGE